MVDHHDLPQQWHHSPCLKSNHPRPPSDVIVEVGTKENHLDHPWPRRPELRFRIMIPRRKNKLKPPTIFFATKLPSSSPRGSLSLYTQTLSSFGAGAFDTQLHLFLAHHRSNQLLSLGCYYLLSGA
ncbi:hypothetical protein AAHA92_21356 [Salvia divinorum]|uniref:Uncharacterized protein n=1 Tax=Salvia divinorum TaxID=28513 RepID=A0ABD1GKM0_SALDI